MLNSCDKPKPKVAPLQLQSCHVVNNAHSPRTVSTKVDSPKTSTVGKLHVLKPSRERNGVPSNAKDNLSLTGSSKLPNSPLAVPSVPLRNPANNPPVAAAERKPGVATLEKRSPSQAQSRNDFFNLMRKKSMTPVIPDTVPSVPASDKPDGAEAPTETKGGVQPSSENESDLTCNVDAYVATERFKNNNSSSDAIILYSEEEEARFLRSLGWDETAEEEEGLTEEEINSFYRDVSKVKYLLQITIKSLNSLF